MSTDPNAAFWMMVRVVSSKNPMLSLRTLGLFAVPPGQGWTLLKQPTSMVAEQVGTVL